MDAGQGGLAEQLGRHRALEADVEVAVGLQAPEQVSGEADEVLGRRRGQRRPDLVPGERAADDVLAGQVDRHGVNGRGPGRRPCRDVQPRRGSGELGGADDRNRCAGPEQAAIVWLLQVAGGEAGRLATGQLAPEALQALGEVIDRVHVALRAHPRVLGRCAAAGWFGRSRRRLLGNCWEIGSPTPCEKHAKWRQ